MIHQLLMEFQINTKYQLYLFFVNLNTYHRDTYYGPNIDSIYNIPDLNKEKYILKIESYACYSKNKERQIGCQNDDNFHEVKTNDTTYKKYT